MSEPESMWVMVSSTSALGEELEVQVSGQGRAMLFGAI
jgi:hypothetical protein